MKSSAIIVLVVAACRAAPEPPQPLPASSVVEVRVGPRPLEVAAGDLDGDGAIDLVSANGGDQTISIRLQRDGAWVAAAGDPLPSAVAAHHLALADVDADGDLDLLATGHDTDGVWVWLGDAERLNSLPNTPVGGLVLARAASSNAGTSISANLRTRSVMGWSKAACSITGASAQSVTSDSLTGNRRRNSAARRCSDCSNNTG